MIWVVIILGTIIVFHYGKKNYVNSYVDENSKRIEKIRELNKKTKYAPMVKPDFLEVDLNNLDQYKKFEGYKYLYKYLSKNKDDIEELEQYMSQKIYNMQLYNRYKEEYENIMKNTGEVARDELFENDKNKRESELVTIEHKPKSLTDQVLIKYEYTTPQGRNHYEEFSILYMTKVEDMINDIEREQTKEEFKKKQRSLMTDKLRYKILKRDHYHCVICGRGAEDGVKLHVDHIKPVSKGGKTVPENLRVLCEDCNLGKLDEYDENADYAR